MKPQELHFFRCRYDNTMLCVTAKGSRPERCMICRSWLTYLYSVPVETDRHRELFRQGRVWNPFAPEPEPWVCKRCGEPQAAKAMKHRRPDGVACDACYKAEAFPPLLTPEQIEAERQRMAALVLSEDERHEAAHRAAEEKQQ